MKKYIKKIKSLWSILKIKLHEKKFEDLPYLFQKNGSDTLMIVFSAFTGKMRRYNYVRSFKDIKTDKLFILDPWGYLGSYNLYENGSSHPMETTLNLIEKIASGGGYKSIYTAGSSKGGTCAIYFGLTVNATAIFSGACQYNLGTYVTRPERIEIFHGMMGSKAGKAEIDRLNNMVKDKIKEKKNTKTVIHVLYSKKELTYERQIVDLLKDLEANHIPYLDVERFFENHDEVSAPFVEYVKEFFSEQTK